MYTWGYLKNVTLANLNIDEDEAVERGYLNKFPYWANEVITQICSAVRAKRCIAEFRIDENDLFTIKEMPDDFISFNSDLDFVRTKNQYDDLIFRECSDDDFIYRTENGIMFLKTGDYEISYNSRWITFDGSMKNDVKLDVPADILECIPTYLAMKCLKTVDDYNSNVFKNEYEMQLARINDTHYEMNESIKIGGDW